jgi:predicted Fe-Mo cluster-binding NifX family protein
VYTIFTIDENKAITNVELLPSPQGCGCKSNIAGILQQKGVKVMLAGNMGQGALNVLNNHGIDVYRGGSGNIRSLVEAFLEGNFMDSGIGCKSHEEHHGHGHEEGHVCNH